MISSEIILLRISASKVCLVRHTKCISEQVIKYLRSIIMLSSLIFDFEIVKKMVLIFVKRFEKNEILLLSSYLPQEVKVLKRYRVSNRELMIMLPNHLIMKSLLRELNHSLREKINLKETNTAIKIFGLMKQNDSYIKTKFQLSSQNSNLIS